MLYRLLLSLILLASVASAAKNALEVYFIDVEGGQATLYVAPSGQSMLVDAGWPGFNGRDAERIERAAKAAGVDQIDYLVITHYHTDHVGGVPQLAERMKIRNFVDHGASFETGKNAEALMKVYSEVRQKGNHIEVKPGDKLPIQGMEVSILTAAGNKIAAPLAGGGGPNALCASFTPKGEDKSENARSVGNIVEFGKVRLINLGDLTWNKEQELVCPNNLIGTVDIYLTTHHGMNASNPETLIHALRPRVAIMNNGAKKGGSPDTWQIIRKSPGLEDIWQLHFALAGGKESNSPDVFIANTDPACQGKWIKLSVQPDGTFTVTNSRNSYSKTYKPRS
jgi:beta-lactamase superfamily II metal-dependent hydrolase